MNEPDDLEPHPGDPEAPPRPPRPPRTPALDAVDLAILDLITGDGRMPLTGLAQRLRLGRSTVQVRLARLEAEGVIDGYTIRQGPNHPAATGLRALLTVAADHRHLPEVSRALERIREVAEVCAVSGDAGLVVDVRATGAANLDSVLTAVRRIEGVVSTHSSVVLASRVPRRRDG